MITTDSETFSSTNTLRFVNVKVVTTVLRAWNTDKLPHPDFRNPFSRAAVISQVIQHPD